MTRQHRVTRVVRRLGAAATVVALATVGLTGIASSASAADGPAPAPAAEEVVEPETVTADALPTWQINGVVWSQVIVGNTVYVTGSFTKARPPGVAAGGAGEVPANNIFAYDLTTGNRVASFNHSLNAQGLVIRSSPDGSRIYVGGDFTSVDGVARGHVATFSTATNALVTNWAPNVGGQVRGFGITADTVYAGGNFTSANGVLRTRLAAFQTSNGAMTSWAPTATGGYVWAMVMAPDNSKVIAGGSFTQLSGGDAYGMGAIDAGTGATLPWQANAKIRDGGSAAAIVSLKSDGAQIIGSGYSFGGGGFFEGTFGLKPSNGSINYVNDCLGDTYDVAAADDVLYAVSHYHDCSAVDAFPDTNPRSRWTKASAQINHGTTMTTKNDAYGWDFRGYLYGKMLHWWPDLAFGTYTPAGQAAWAVDTSGDYVVMGGEFPRVNGANQQGLTRMRKHSAAPNLRGPRYTTIPATPIPTTNAVSLAAGSVRVSWGSAWDQDNEELTYEVLRDNVTWLTPVKAKSAFWNLPKLGLIDTGLAPGSTHRYQVRIKDADGNLLWSPASNTVTVGTGATSAYATSVVSDGPEHFWRIGEPSGATGIDNAGFDDVTFNGNYTRGVAGAIGGDSDAASRFDGSSGFAASSAPVQGPNVFSEEAWFRTTSTTGGKIISFGDQKTGTSNNYDRHVYMDPSGKVWFGVYNNNSYTVNTSTALNDGQWHHVVGTLDGNGVTLYVDGKRIGRNAGTTTAQPYAGYWRIGGDSAWNGNPYFNGDIDEVAIYPTALSLVQVQKHFTDSGRTLDVATRPSDTYGRAVWDSSPDLYWRLGENTGTTAKDSSPNEANATYFDGYTQGTAGAVTGTTDTAVTLDGNRGAVAANNPVSNPTVYSEELWFKTTTDQGGKLIGFGCSQTGNSACYDRHIWMKNDGTLTFGVWTGSENTISTSRTYNDGQWHHVVSSQGADGMKFWVDGLLAGTNGQTQQQPYDGYWRVGGDTTWGGNSSNWFAGSIDEVAVYSSVLSENEVKAHFQAGGGQLANEVPTAAFTHTENGLKVSVDGSTSSDPDGTIASYAWDFGDGGSATTAAANHTYSTGGDKTVTLTVTDNRGGTNSHAETVTVTAPPPNQAPTAAFSSTKAYLKLAVDGSGSADADGTVDSYSWNWGDGTSAGSGESTTHTYADAGTFTVVLTVTDDDGATATKESSITVVANQAPTASFTHDETLLNVIVDASGSIDPDGTVASYAWKWGDGTPNGSGGSTSHSYATSGTYTITLTVTDNAGETDSDSTAVTVTGPPNQVPVASFTHAENGLSVDVNGSGSSDPDGTVSSYAWTFGDGGTATTPTANHTYTAAGTYEVTLTVTDNDGAANTKGVDVTVQSPTFYAKDDFGRTVANGWGSADTGGPWTISGPAARWSVASGVGKVSLNVGDGYTAYLPSVSSTDTEVTTVVTSDKTPTGGGQYMSVVGRRVSATADYRVKVRLAAGAAVSMQLMRKASGTETAIGNATVAGLTFAAGDRLNVRVQVNGTSPTTVRAKVWKVGTTEPASWNVTGTDSTAGFQTAGSAGVYAYVSGSATNGPVVFGFDEMWVGATRP